jgi:hypothetical protein
MFFVSRRYVPAGGVVDRAYCGRLRQLSGFRELAAGDASDGQYHDLGGRLAFSVAQVFGGVFHRGLYAIRDELFSGGDGSSG